MAVRYSQQRRRPYGTILFLVLAAVALAWVVVPLSRGEEVPDPVAFVKRAFGGEVQAAERSDDGNSPVAEGRVRVFVSGREIPAYSKVNRNDLWDATKGTWAYTDIPESLAESEDILVDVQDIVGRVMAHPKPVGYVFTENDFLPEGTRPGPAAGVPAGKRALRIDVEKVQGIVGLGPGDRFDMVAAVALDDSLNRAQPAFAGVYSDLMRQRRTQGTYARARVQVLVQNGVVVTPLQTRQVPTTSSSLTQGVRVRTIPVQEMIIALAPEEVAPFMEALSVDAEITCLARSGRPDDPVDSVTPSSDPLPSWGGSFFPGGDAPSDTDGLTVIESISGQERALIPVPESGSW